MSASRNNILPYAGSHSDEVESLVIKFVTDNNLCVKTWEEIQVGDLFFEGTGFLLSYREEKQPLALVTSKIWSKDNKSCSINFVVNERFSNHTFNVNNKYYYIVVQESVL